KRSAARDMRLDRPERNAAATADLGMAHALAIRQDDAQTNSGGQSRQSRVQIEPLRHRAARGRGTVRSIRIFRGEITLSTAQVGKPVVDSGLAYPRAECRGRAQRADRFPSANEG